MEEEIPTLFGFPIVASEQVPVGTAILGPMPTFDEVVRHGSFANAVKARAREYGIITDLDNPEIG